MAKREPHVAVLARAAALWPQLTDTLPPRSIRVIEKAAGDLAASIDGPVTADYVAGLIVGVALDAKVREERQGRDPLAKAWAQLKPDTGVSEATLVACCLAHQVSTGELAP